MKKKICSCSLGLMALTLVFTTNAQVPKTDKKIIMYWTTWGGLAPTDIRADLLTNLLFAFVNVNSNGVCELRNPASDTEHLAGFRKLKSMYPHIKVQLSVGGWSLSQHFSSASSTAYGRAKLAKSCVDILNEHGLDGLDIDWEFPVNGGMPENGRLPQDKENYTLLLKEMKSRMNPRHLLTIAGHNHAVWNMELSKMRYIIDWVNIMSYDYTGGWRPVAEHGSALYSNPAGPMIGSIDTTVTAYINSGMPASQIAVGVPFYGKGAANAWNGLFGVSSGVFAAGVYRYRTIKSTYSKDQGYIEYWDNVAKVPYCINSELGRFITYENSVSVALKSDYVVKRGLLGVMAWELTQDTYDYELLTSMKNALEVHGGSPSASADISTDSSTYIGCFADIVNARALEHYSGSTVETLETCMAYCFERSEMFFGLEFGGECFCGDSGYDRYGSLDEERCGMPCDSAPEQICGGSDALSVYRIDALAAADTPEPEIKDPEADLGQSSNLPKGTTFIGCFIDDVEDRALEHYSRYEDSTIEICRAYCSGREKMYFGLEFGGECYCGDSGHERYGKLDYSFCSMPCIANPEQMCGGSDALSVYRIDTLPLRLLDSRQEMNESEAKLMETSTDDSSTNQKNSSFVALSVDKADSKSLFAHNGVSKASATALSLSYDAETIMISLFAMAVGISLYMLAVFVNGSIQKREKMQEIAEHGFPVPSSSHQDKKSFQPLPTSESSV